MNRESLFGHTARPCPCRRRHEELPRAKKRVKISVKEPEVAPMRTAAILILLALAGCATIEGVGRDISAGARAVNDMI